MNQNTIKVVFSEVSPNQVLSSPYAVSAAFRFFSASSDASLSSASTTSTSKGNVRIAAMPVSWLSSETLVKDEKS